MHIAAHNVRPDFVLGTSVPGGYCTVTEVKDMTDRGFVRITTRTSPEDMAAHPEWPEFVTDDVSTMTDIDVLLPVAPSEWSKIEAWGAVK